MDTPQGAGSTDLGGHRDSLEWTRFQQAVCALVALALAVDGLANQALGLAIPALMHDWGLRRGAFAPVAALGLVGVAIGAALGGVLGDRRGRRLGLIGSVVLFGLATAATAWVHGTAALAALRFVAGVGLGSTIPNATSLVAEFSPVRRRSLAVGLAFICVPLGSLVSGLLAAAILPRAGWRLFFAVDGILPLGLAAALWIWLPEPAGIVARGPGGAMHGPGRANAALFGAVVRRDTLALWAAFFCCVMALYSMFSWAPALLAGHGFGLAATSSLMAAFNFGGIGGAVGSIWLIQRFGSRLTAGGLCLFGVAGALLLAAMPLHPAANILPLTAAFVGESFFIGGFQNTLYPLVAQLYPPFARATGVGAASAAGRLGAIASSFTGVLTLQWRGAPGFFAFLGVIMAAGMLCTLMIRRQIPRQS